MKKIFLCFCLILILVLLNILQVTACWAAPEPFEIFSADGSKVFVFVPTEDGAGNAYAAVYEIENNERKLFYIVDELSSFAYEGNFYFSTDMMNFIRTFPAPGMPVFEAFSNDVRTRVVMRNDFIENYADGGDFPPVTSIGPTYTINWRIEEHTNNDTIKITTDEGNTLFFDLASAKFYTEDALLLENNSIFEIPSEDIFISVS
jgi:hypothetical protein